MSAEPLGSAILDTGKSPAEWQRIFAERGIVVSERSLRQKARELGACHVLGKAMIITPAQIDRILEEGTCRSSRTSEVQYGGPRAVSNITVERSPTTSAKALEHLKKAALGTGSRNAKRKSNVVTLLASSTARSPSQTL
jgi:hypothetical protein